MFINPETIKSDISANAPGFDSYGFDEGHSVGHLVTLPNVKQWALWRWVGLRGTGFPVKLVSELSSAECAEAALRLIEAEETAEQQRAEVVRSLKRELEQTEEMTERRLLSKVILRLKKGRDFEPATEAFNPQTDLTTWRQSQEELDQARENYKQRYRDTAREISEAIHRVAHTNRFQEAVTWQNRGAVSRGIRSLLKREPGTSGSRQRRNEELVASYLQRYCTKNDTIGFFGPVGWARFTDDGPALTLVPGASLLAQREVYFEHWCIDTLAATLALDPALRPHLKPRRLPYLRLDGLTLHQPLEPPVELAPVEQALLAGSNGQQTARQLVRGRLAQQEQLGEQQLYTEEQLYEVLEQLRARGLVNWGLEVPMQVRPDEALRALLGAVEDDDLRREKLGALDELERARRRVASAAGGEVEVLDAALAELEQTFTRLTGCGATRAAGRTYAGRTLVYEDCRRHLDAAFGEEVRQRLSGALGLLLKSARWMTAEVGARYRREFSIVYEELRARGGAGAVVSVSAVDFWLRVQRLIFGEKTGLAAGVVAELQRRWQEVLGAGVVEREAAGVEERRYASAELARGVEAAFGGVRRGWRSARYHSPDVMIAAQSAAAVGRGEYELVLGELHVGVNTLGAGSFVAQHPQAQELYEAVAADIPHPGVFPITPKFFPKNTARTGFALILPSDYYLQTAADMPTDNGAGLLSIGELMIEEEAGQLFVRAPSRQLSFDIIDFFGEALSLVVISNFKPFAASAHQRRISIDGVVVCRESWNLPAHDLVWTGEPEEAQRFLAARRWQRHHHMPRAVFVKVPSEAKPFYVDFASPVYVTLLARAVQRSVERGAGEQLVSVSEMLPGIGQAWLEDAQAERYTCELRLVAVDLV